MTTRTESKCGAPKAEPVPDHRETLRQRMEYLGGRARIKAEQGWENTYDLRERDALKWALEKLDG